MKVGSLLNQEVIGIQQAVSVLLLLVEIFGAPLNLLQIFFGEENYIQRDIGTHIPIMVLQVYLSVALKIHYLLCQYLHFPPPK